MRSLARRRSQAISTCTRYLISPNSEKYSRSETVLSAYRPSIGETAVSCESVAVEAESRGALHLRSGAEAVGWDTHTVRVDEGGELCSHILRLSVAPWGRGKPCGRVFLYFAKTVWWVSALCV